MGYDGGNTIKIINKKLGEVLDEFAEKGYFQWGEVQKLREKSESDIWDEEIPPWDDEPDPQDETTDREVKYTLLVEFWDFAIVEGCPKDIKEVGEYIVELIRSVEDEISYAQLDEIRQRIKQDDVVSDYEFVYWEYACPDGVVHSDFEDSEEFVYKK